MKTMNPLVEYYKNDRDEDGNFVHNKPVAEHSKEIIAVLDKSSENERVEFIEWIENEEKRMAQDSNGDVK